MWFVLIGIANFAFSTHAILDAMCVVCVLFPTTTERWLGDFCASGASELYTWIFVDEEDRSNPTLRRFVVYWVAAMSLVRAFAIVLTVTAVTSNHAYYYFITLVYWLEALAFEYECTLGASMRRTTARIAAGASLVLGGLALAIATVKAEGAPPPQ
jgi:hypothetical protein